MLSIKFTKKDRGVDQRIERATIGPRGVEFTWRYGGEPHVLSLPKACLQTLIDSVTKSANTPITCPASTASDSRITAHLDGNCVQLDYAEHGTAKTERLSVKSLLALKTLLSLPSFS